MIYGQLFRFLLPLVVTVVIQELSGQVLSGGMARMPRATETLASYGLAWGLVMFMTSTLAQTRQLGLVLVEDRRSFRKVQWVVLSIGALLSGVLVCMERTPLGVWVIEDLHRVDPSLSAVVLYGLFWLTPIPVCFGLIRFNSGMLMRARRTDLVSYATVSGIVASVGTVFVLLPTDFVRTAPIRLPLLVTYAGVLTELGVVLWGRRRAVVLPAQTGGAPLTVGYVIRFFWPLAVIMALQGVSRPVINLFVARGPDGPEALAALTVVYALAHVPYGWVNEIRNLHTAFKDVENSLYAIWRFAIGCGVFSFGVMAAAFWTPVRDFWLETLIGVDADLAAVCMWPLVLFSFFPLTVMARAYFHGVGLLTHRTRAMTPSAPARIGAIVLVLLVLPVELHGATRGIAALLSGFVAEMVTVWWCVQGRHRFGRRE